MAYITGEIRDQGSNFSHETRFARLLSTLLLLGNFWDSSIRFLSKKTIYL